MRPRAEPGDERRGDEDLKFFGFAVTPGPRRFVPPLQGRPFWLSLGCLSWKAGCEPDRHESR